MFPIAPYIAVLAVNPTFAIMGVKNVEMASHSFSLNDRYAVPSVNAVFKDNILLTLNYMSSTVNEKKDIDWEEIKKPSHFEFKLSPNETFAFHDQILPEFKNSVVKTTNAHFNATDGFKSDGWLYGDGVCHLASLIHWAATDAGLTSVSLASHDFANIPEIPKEYGVSIKYMPGESNNSSRQNLYITDNFEYPVTFDFNYDGEKLVVQVLKNPVAN